jgi:phage gpG-like protein
MLSITVTGVDAVEALLDAMAPGVRQKLREELTELTAALLARVKSKLAGETLALRTGRLRESLYQQVEASGTTVEARIVVPGLVPYAAIHEFGGTIQEHLIAARKAQALRFVAGSKDVFTRRVVHPGARMPERSYLRAALAEMEGEVVASLRQAVADETAGRWR